MGPYRGRQRSGPSHHPELTLKMRGRSLDWAWITSGARTGVAVSPWEVHGAGQRSASAPAAPSDHSPPPLLQTMAWHPPQIQSLQGPSWPELSFGSGASKSSRRESLRRRTLAASPARTPEGVAPLGEGRQAQRSHRADRLPPARSPSQRQLTDRKPS